jgi:hypothetical protein
LALISDDGINTIIRPLAYAKESDIEQYSQIKIPLSFPVIFVALKKIYKENTALINYLTLLLIYFWYENKQIATRQKLLKLMATLKPISLNLFQLSLNIDKEKFRLSASTTL